MRFKRVKTAHTQLIVLFACLGLLIGCQTDSYSHDNGDSETSLTVEDVAAYLALPLSELEADENDCYPFEYFDASTDECVTDVVCETDEECDRFDALYDDYLERLDALDFTDSVSFDYSSSGDDSESRSRYNIVGKTIEFEQGQAEDIDQTVWTAFVGIMPASVWQPHVSQFSVFDDGLGNTLAYVVQTEDADDLWELSIDANDYLDDYGEFVHTVIHESAHIIALNRSQIDYENYDNCETYLIDEGCVLPSGYLLAFYEAFWTPALIKAHAKTEEDEDKVYEFYERNAEQFVSDYAATNAIEDFAESFALFVLKPRNDSATEVKEQKAQFFFNYAELDQVRLKIRENLAKKNF